MPEEKIKEFIDNIVGNALFDIEFLDYIFNNTDIKDKEKYLKHVEQAKIELGSIRYHFQKDKKKDKKNK